MNKKQILEKYGETNVTVKPRVGNAGWVPSESTGRVYELTVNEAMKNWDGTHWTARNEYVKIEFDEDYGHMISLID